MRALKNRPIGVFDSGVGGLTVARSIRRCLPEEDVVYFGDTARVPYGNKSRETVVRFAKEIMAFMMERDVKMVVVACNTASSFSLNVLKKLYPVSVIGVIKPGVREAVAVSESGRIGVIGTKSTVSSRAYDREFARTGRKVRLFSRSCPLFVPLVENKHVKDDIAHSVAKKYLKYFKERDIDTLILGCTHYPILKEVIGDIMGGVKLVDSSTAVAGEVRTLLSRGGIEASRRKRGRMSCFVSDDVDGFRNMAGIFLREKVGVKKVVL